MRCCNWKHGYVSLRVKALSQNVHAFLHCDQVIEFQEEDRFIPCELDSASGETAKGHYDAKTRSAMVYYAVKITNDMRPNLAM